MTTRALRKMLLLCCFLVPLLRPCNAQVRDLRVGFPGFFFNEFDIRDAKAAIEVWSKTALANLTLDYVPTAVIITDIDQMKDLVTAAEVDLIDVPALDFFRFRGKNSLEPILLGPAGDHWGDRFVLFVNQHSDIRGLEQLRGREIVLHPDGSEEIMRMWLDVELSNQGLPMNEDFFSRVKAVSKASQAALPVFFRQTDACLMKERIFDVLAELNPQINEQLLSLRHSPRYIKELFCMTGRLKNGERQRIREACLQIGRDPSGKQILTLFKTHDVLPYRPEFSANLQELYRQHQKLITAE